MGGQMSKKTGETPFVLQLHGNLEYKADLSSYEAECGLDPDLQSFDVNLQDRTNHVIKALAVGVEVRAISFDSLKEITGCLLEMNQEVAKITLDCKQDIWKNPELFELVEAYFENSLQTLDLCTSLEKCLKRARESQLIINVALQQFEEEDKEEGMKEKKYLRTLEELRNFKAAGDPFMEEFFQIFQSVYKQQELMLEKLQLQKSKLGKKLKSRKAWRKISNMFFAVAFASVLIFSIVAAAIAAPHVAAVFAAAASIPLGSMGKWFNSFLKTYEDAIKRQKEVTISMQTVTNIAIKDLDTIRVLIDRLEIEIESVMKNADFSLREGDAVKFGIEEIKKILGVFTTSIEDLGKHADRCSTDIRRARTVILQKIIKKK